MLNQVSDSEYSGINYVWLAFVEDAPSEASVIAGAIIDRWYHGSPLP